MRLNSLAPLAKELHSLPILCPCILAQGHDSGGGNLSPGDGYQGVCSVCSVAKSCLTLGDPMDSSLPDSSVHGILQVRTLELVAIPSPEELPNPGIESLSPALAGGLFTTEPHGLP